MITRYEDEYNVNEVVLIARVLNVQGWRWLVSFIVAMDQPCTNCWNDKDPRIWGSGDNGGNDVSDG